jgi:hypothetical protein
MGAIDDSGPLGRFEYLSFYRLLQTVSSLETRLARSDEFGMNSGYLGDQVGKSAHAFSWCLRTLGGPARSPILLVGFECVDPPVGAARVGAADVQTPAPRLSTDERWAFHALRTELGLLEGSDGGEPLAVL